MQGWLHVAAPSTLTCNDVAPPTLTCNDVTVSVLVIIDGKIAGLGGVGGGVHLDPLWNGTRTHIAVHTLAIE